MVYFPDNYNDFNEVSGMMFMEMASYVGDVLSYYIDISSKEYVVVEETKAVYNMDSKFRYKPRLATPASVNIDLFQTVPAKSSGTGASYTTEPDLRYVEYKGWVTGRFYKWCYIHILRRL